MRVSHRLTLARQVSGRLSLGPGPRPEPRTAPGQHEDQRRAPAVGPEGRGRRACCSGAAGPPTGGGKTEAGGHAPQSVVLRRQQLGREVGDRMGPPESLLGTPATVELSSGITTAILSTCSRGGTVAEGGAPGSKGAERRRELAGPLRARCKSHLRCGVSCPGRAPAVRPGGTRPGGGTPPARGKRVAGRPAGCRARRHAREPG